jgi:hypothetical protein
VLVAKEAAGKIFQLEVGNKNGSALVSASVQRTGLAIVGQKRDKTPIVDFNRRIMCTRLWPRMRGGPVQVRMGAQEGPNDPVGWSAPQSFDPSGQQFLDFTVEGKALAVEYSSFADVSWELEGHKLEILVDGEGY